MVLSDVTQDFRTQLSLTTSNSQYFYQGIPNLQLWLFSIMTSFTQRCKRSTKSNSIKILDYQSRNFIRWIIRKWFLCLKYEGPPYSYPSPPQPYLVSRLSDDFSFRPTSFDYTGPLYVRHIYPVAVCSCTNEEWIVLFTCARSRAFYIFRLSTWLQCSHRVLKIYFSNHGVPNEICEIWMKTQI